LGEKLLPAAVLEVKFASIVCVAES
jgi:hypothetical protein